MKWMCLLFNNFLKHQTPGIQNLFDLFKTKILKKLFALFLQIHETPYLSFPSLSSKRDHEEMEQEDYEVMGGTDKKIKT